MGEARVPTTAARVLAALVQGGPLDREALAERLGKSTTAITSALQRLSLKGQVRANHPGKNAQWEVISDG